MNYQCYRMGSVVFTVRRVTSIPVKYFGTLKTIVRQIRSFPPLSVRLMTSCFRDSVSIPYTSPSDEYSCQQDTDKALQVLPPQDEKVEENQSFSSRPGSYKQIEEQCSSYYRDSPRSTYPSIGNIEDVAECLSTIDTNLPGSNQDDVFGSLEICDL